MKRRIRRIALERQASDVSEPHVAAFETGNSVIFEPPHRARQGFRRNPGQRRQVLARQRQDQDVIARRQGFAEVLVQHQQQVEQTCPRRMGDGVHVAVLRFGHVDKAGLQELQPERRVVGDQPAHPATGDEADARGHQHFCRDLVIGTHEQRTIADDLPRPAQSHQGRMAVRVMLAQTDEPAFDAVDALALGALGVNHLAGPVRPGRLCRTQRYPLTPRQHAPFGAPADLAVKTVRAVRLARHGARPLACFPWPRWATTGRSHIPYHCLDEHQARGTRLVRFRMRARVRCNGGATGRKRMTDDSAVWPAAANLIGRFGDAAVEEAGLRAHELRESGNAEAAAFWTAVRQAVEVLLHRRLDRSVH